MAKDKQKSEKLCTMLMMISFIVTLLSCYWQIAPMLARMGISNKYVNMAMLMYKDYFSQPFKIKVFCFILLCCSSTFRIGKKVEKSWKEIIITTIAGTALYLLCPAGPILYFLLSMTGMCLIIYGTSLLFRKLKGDEAPDEDEGFEQTTKNMPTKYSVNIPYEFVWKKKWHKGWINCINPFRASIVLGSPGSGKSFAIYNAFIEQMLRKEYTMFVYDYKFPDLTERVLTELAYQRKHENLWKNMKVKPHIYIINFDDPLKSNRCNPIHHSYITDPADTTEIADLVFKNINKGSDGKGFDFFNESAKVLLDGVVWYLANYDPDAIYAEDELTVVGSKTNYVNKGCYCTFPHVIEMMAVNYKSIFQILQFTKGLEAKISPFASALESDAMEQLSGQVASAQIPLGKFVSPALYWVMTGEDFTLDINNPEAPKIICMGNNPDRQSIYGTTLALYTSRMFKLINHKHKMPSSVLLDEVPTIFVKGLDNLIATARSNKVAIVLGAQDQSQLNRDYGDKEAEVIVETVGNLFSGSVTGRTAEKISKGFGKIKRKRVSHSIGDDSDSKSYSYQDEDILPTSKIMDMTQGMFCGWIKDNFGEEISQKKFFGKITVDIERNKALDKEFIKVPEITDIFNGKKPNIPAEDIKRLSLIYPQLKNNQNALEKKYIDEKVNERVAENFNKIKNDIKELVRKELERTEGPAARYKEERESSNK